MTLYEELLAIRERVHQRKEQYFPCPTCDIWRSLDNLEMACEQAIDATPEGQQVIWLEVALLPSFEMEPIRCRIAE